MTDRVSERRRAAQLARHYRDQEGLSIAVVARELRGAASLANAVCHEHLGLLLA